MAWSAAPAGIRWSCSQARLALHPSGTSSQIRPSQVHRCCAPGASSLTRANERPHTAHAGHEAFESIDVSNQHAQEPFALSRIIGL